MFSPQDSSDAELVEKQMSPSVHQGQCSLAGCRLLEVSLPRQPLTQEASSVALRAVWVHHGEVGDSTQLSVCLVVVAKIIKTQR